MFVDSWCIDTSVASADQEALVEIISNNQEITSVSSLIGSHYLQKYLEKYLEKGPAC